MLLTFLTAIGPSRQAVPRNKAAFFRPTVANGALRTWLDLQLARRRPGDVSGDVLHGLRG
jgi:hypothetical protein